MSMAGSSQAARCERSPSLQCSGSVRVELLERSSHACWTVYGGLEYREPGCGDGDNSRHRVIWAMATTGAGMQVSGLDGRNGRETRPAFVCDRVSSVAGAESALTIAEYNLCLVNDVSTVEALKRDIDLSRWRAPCGCLKSIGRSQSGTAPHREITG